MKGWAAVLLAVAGCSSGAPPVVDPYPVAPLLSQGELGLDQSVRLKVASLQSGGYSIVVENLRSAARTCRAEIRFQDDRGNLLIPADPGPFRVDLRASGEASLRGACPFPQAKKVLVRLSE